MKKLALVLMLLTGIQAAMAQEGPIISSAVIAIDRNNDLAAAKKYIDEAAGIVATKPESEIGYKDLRKFYYYNGLINFRVFQSEDPAIKALDEGALDKAAEYISKTISYEKEAGKERYTNDAKQLLPYIANAYAQRGIDKSGAEDYAGAYEDFYKTYEMKKQAPINVVDTAMLYNAALMAQNGGMNQKAIDILEQLIEMNYKSVVYKATEAESGEVAEFNSKQQMDLMIKSGKYKDPVAEGDIRADLYITTANLYRKEGDTTKYDQLVAEGRTKFPQNENLLRAELQKFLETQQYDKALVNLNQAIEKDPENKLFYYIKGFILQTEVKDQEKAMEAYAKASELDPTYIEPLYMQGLIHVDRANALSEKINKLGLNEKGKYNSLMEEQKEEFQKALPFFEKVYAIDPKDEDTLKALKEVYYKLKMYEDAKRVNQELVDLQ